MIAPGFPVQFREPLFEFPAALRSPVALGESKDVHEQEERRLLYVGMTRARDRLWCYLPLRYHTGVGRARLSDRHAFGQRSRFLTDAVVATMTSEGDARAVDDAQPAAGAPATAADEPLAEVDALVSALLD